MYEKLYVNINLYSVVHDNVITGTNCYVHIIENK